MSKLDVGPYSMISQDSWDSLNKAGGKVTERKNCVEIGIKPFPILEKVSSEGTRSNLNASSKSKLCL